MSARRSDQWTRTSIDYKPHPQNVAHHPPVHALLTRFGWSVVNGHFSWARRVLPWHQTCQPSRIARVSDTRIHSHPHAHPHDMSNHRIQELFAHAAALWWGLAHIQVNRCIYYRLFVYMYVVIHQFCVVSNLRKLLFLQIISTWILQRGCILIRKYSTPKSELDSI